MALLRCFPSTQLLLLIIIIIIMIIFEVTDYLWSRSTEIEPRADSTMKRRTAERRSVAAESKIFHLDHLDHQVAEVAAEVSRHEAANSAREAAPQPAPKHRQVRWSAKQGGSLPPRLPWLWKPSCCLSTESGQHPGHPWIPDFTSDGGRRSGKLQGRPNQGFSYPTTGSVTHI